jgi:putative peptidoglycan lipid II flippase
MTSKPIHQDSDFSATQQSQPKYRSSSRNAVVVGAGILCSKFSGLLREGFFAHFFGVSDAADVFKAAFRIPNLIQNLFGEGALSSSFIPVYSGLLTSDREEAKRVARIIGSLLMVVISILVLAGVFVAPYMVDLIAPGFEGEKRELTIRLVRIFFPSAGVFAISAWCLGILNSHRRFFLPYAATILWNLAMIGALWGFHSKYQDYRLAEIMALGSVIGSILQFGIQLPTVIRLIGRFRFQLETVSSNIRTIIRNFIPSVTSRGVAQLSGYIDENFATSLASGAMAQLTYALTLYLIPVSLFGMSIANAELPEMSSQTGSDEAVAAALLDRLKSAMRRVAFFIIPSVAVFLALGDSVVAFLYQRGKFTSANVGMVWAVLAGSTVGLLAATLSRLYNSAFFALRDTRTPLCFAVVRVALTAGLGWTLAFKAPAWLGLPPRMGVIGLTISAGMAAWVEFALLRSALGRRIGIARLPVSYLIKIWSIAILATIPAFSLKLLMKGFPPLVSGPFIFATFGLIYLGSAAAFKVPEALILLRSIGSKLRSK